MPWSVIRTVAVITPGFPDGLKVDRRGRVYASSFSGVQMFTALGERMGNFALPGAVNFCFGGADEDLLFITTDSALWVVEQRTERDGDRVRLRLGVGPRVAADLGQRSPVSRQHRSAARHRLKHLQAKPLAARRRCHHNRPA